MAKRALITGVTGQDGSLLSKLLLDKGYDVYGAYRRTSTPNFWRLNSLGIFDKIKLIPFDLSDITSINEAITISDPEEIYNLAAQSFVSAAFEQPIATGITDGLAVTAFLEGIRHINPSIKLYNAATSEMFGVHGFTKERTEGNKPLDEQSYFEPASPYGAAKLYGYWQNKIYRKAYNLFTCNGILFNHESSLRGLEFVTRKITNGVAKIYVGIEKELVLGNLKPARDWGYAPEYVEGMWRMLQHKEPDDYVLATGDAHSVFAFAKEAFDIAGLKWQDYIKIDKRFIRPMEVNFLRGNNAKAKKKLGWKPKTSFTELVKIMVDADINRWERLLNGETFPWDAPNYSSEARIITRNMKN
jgi:GDPmannose 4,6-dehydratase